MTNKSHKEKIRYSQVKLGDLSVGSCMQSKCQVLHPRARCKQTCMVGDDNAEVLIESRTFSRSL